jgi:hypothetical protein
VVILAYLALEDKLLVSGCLDEDIGNGIPLFLNTVQI